MRVWERGERGEREVDWANCMVIRSHVENVIERDKELSVTGGQRSEGYLHLIWSVCLSVSLGFHILTQRITSALDFTCISDFISAVYSRI